MPFVAPPTGARFYYQSAVPHYEPPGLAKGFVILVMTRAPKMPGDKRPFEGEGAEDLVSMANQEDRVFLDQKVFVLCRVKCYL